MRLAVLTDASCDLPESSYQQYGIKLLPNALRIGRQWVLDERDAHISDHVYRVHLQHDAGNTEWQVASAGAIHQRIVERLMPRYEYVLFITSDSRQSSLHRHATQAAFGLLDHDTKLSLDPQASARFGIRIVDSRHVGAGLGRLVLEACEQLTRGASPADVAAAIEQCRHRLHCRCVPGPSQRPAASPNRWWARLQQRLGRVPLLQRDRHGAYRALRHHASRARAIDALLVGMAATIARGEVIGPIVVAHGGDLNALLARPAYHRLEAAAAQAGLALLSTRISVSRTLELGVGATELAYLGHDDV